jgi:hypothetical protein
MVPVIVAGWAMSVTNATMCQAAVWLRGWAPVGYTVLQAQEQRRAFWKLQHKLQNAAERANRTYAEVSCTATVAKTAAGAALSAKTFMSG